MNWLNFTSVDGRYLQSHRDGRMQHSKVMIQFLFQSDKIECNTADFAQSVNWLILNGTEIFANRQCRMHEK